jgi:para-nitrobenzyl esterase
VTLPIAEKAGVAFAAAVGIPGASVSDLRQLTAEAVLKAGDPVITEGGGTIADGQTLPMSPLDAFAKGLQAKVPYLTGFNSLEFPIPEADLDKGLATVVSVEQRKRIATSYPTPESFATHVASDLLFNEPALALARLHAANGNPTWVYQFSVLSRAAPPIFKGAPHASDRQYVFQTLKASPWPTDDNDVVQAQTISAYWTSFARTGDPNGAGRPAWPEYDTQRDQLLDFSNDGPMVVPVPRAAAMKAIAAERDGSGDRQ